SGLRDVLAAVPRQAVLDDLAALDAADLPAPATGSDDLLLRRTLKEVRDESGRGRRRQWLGVAAGIVAVAALSGAGGLAIGRSGAVDLLRLHLHVHGLQRAFRGTVRRRAVLDRELAAVARAVDRAVGHLRHRAAGVRARRREGLDRALLGLGEDDAFLLQDQ